MAFAVPICHLLPARAESDLFSNRQETLLVIVRRLTGSVPMLAQFLHQSLLAAACVFLRVHSVSPDPLHKLGKYFLVFTSISQAVRLYSRLMKRAENCAVTGRLGLSFRTNRVLSRFQTNMLLGENALMARKLAPKLKRMTVPAFGHEKGS